MSNKNEFKKIIESDFNKEKNYNAIINKIEDNKAKGMLKIKYACIIGFLLLSVIGISFAGVKARDMLKNYRIEKQNNKTDIFFDNKLNKDYDSNLFAKSNYYTLNEIEEKLQIKLLKNKLYDKYFDSELYYLANYEVNNGKIDKLKFDLVNNDKSARNLAVNWLDITINIDSDNKLNASLYGSEREQYEYYINSLGTVAFIDKIASSSKYTGSPVWVYFSYNDIIYSLRFEMVYGGEGAVVMYGNPSYVAMHDSDLYEFLESFTIE